MKAMVVCLITAMLQPAEIIAKDDPTVWLYRGLMMLGLGAIGWILRDAAATMKSLKVTQNEMAITLATHNIMFEHWVSELTEHDLDNPGRRKSDELLRKVLELNTQHAKKR